MARLSNSGSFESTDIPNKSEGNYVDKKCVLVYPGVFQSMDGEVTITAEHIEKLSKAFNDKINLSKASKTELEMRDYPPVQLDHSTSAKDTVGRLIGPLELGEYKGMTALYGTVRILGEENCEKVKDGRWAHLSIGADLDKSEIQELTITPFPAAKNATLLKEGKEKMGKKKLEDEKVEDKKEENETKKDEETEESKAKLKEEEDKEKLKKLESEKDEEKKELSAEETEEEKKKKHEESESAEKEKKEHENENMKKRMSSALNSFKDKAGTVRLAMRKQSIVTRLSALKSHAKITPAEIKKIDLVKLASSNDETLNAVLKSYEDREPVIHTGIFGSAKAVAASDLAKQIKMSALEQETRANMTSISKVKLSDTKPGKPSEVLDPVQSNPAVLSDDDHASMWNEMVKHIKAGDEDTAKELFNTHMKHMKRLADDNDCAHDEMKAMLSAFEGLEGEFNNVVKLATTELGIKL